MRDPAAHGCYPAFDRQFLASDEDFTVIGGGALGGKATGLAAIKRIITESCPPGAFPDVDISIPTLTVIGTDAFEQFLAQNDLRACTLSDEPDEHIAHAFQRAELPPTIVGDLRALVERLHTPLAVRSSSLLEDALRHPFAGTYATKMIPNNALEADVRFQRLTEAIKFVWASTYFRDAQNYLRAIGVSPARERMAVIIQEVVGQRHHDRFYPTLSGVMRTHNFYPSGPARPADGVASLALGLGKTIVDGGVCWTYSPAHPRHGAPFGSVPDLLHNTQTRFWAVQMGPPPPYDPINAAEYLVERGLDDAAADGVLGPLVSTYDADADRLVMGMGRPGPRVLTFAPLLELADVPLNAIILRLAQCCKAALAADVEIEFAMTLGPGRGRPARFGFLQLRPLMIANECVDVAEHEVYDPCVLVASERVLGRGAPDGLTDVVYVKPATFAARHTRTIAQELEVLNRRLADAGCNYVLIGFGRWGSSDPWLGIPVTWPQISAARVIVEATRPDMNVEASQGAYFFHNMLSFQVAYFTVRHDGPQRVAWAWLDALPAATETDYVRHVRAPQPLHVRVDGRAGRGIILHA